MRKSIVSLAFLAIASAATFTSCEKVEPTELTAESYAGKVTVNGFVRYSAKDSDLLPTKPIEVKAGTEVLIRQEIGEGAFQGYVTTTDKYGNFSVELGCKLNESVKVTVKASFQEYTYAATEDSKKVNVKATFYGEKTVNVAEGSAAYVDVMLAPVSSIEKPGLAFYGEKTVNVAEGSAAYVDVMHVPVSSIEKPGLAF